MATFTVRAGSGCGSGTAPFRAHGGPLPRVGAGGCRSRQLAPQPIMDSFGSGHCGSEHPLTAHFWLQHRTVTASSSSSTVAPWPVNGRREFAEAQAVTFEVSAEGARHTQAGPAQLLFLLWVAAIHRCPISTQCAAQATRSCLRWQTCLSAAVTWTGPELIDAWQRAHRHYRQKTSFK